jgi:drug/metabolite transporter (DMT)-like permease
MMLGVVFALFNAVCAAGAMTQIRRLQETETTASIVIYFCLFVSLAGLVTLPFGWRVPQTQSEILILAALSLVGGFGQIFHTASYRYASPSMLAPFEYTAMIWAFLIGYFFFGEVPTVYLVGGALIVTGAGLFVIWRESRLGLKRLRETNFAPSPAEADMVPDNLVPERSPVKTP